MSSEKKDLPVLYDGLMERNGQLEKAALHVERPVYQIEDLNEATLYGKPHTTYGQVCRKVLCSCDCREYVSDTVPILKWLPEYNWRSDIIGDILSGITVAVMHIPQGMAYGMLGNLPPIVGIYMAFFPVLIYFFFGTSRHASIGTFAIVCLMTGKIVTKHSNAEFLSNGTLVLQNGTDPNGPIYTNMEVATAVTFTVALIQIVMYVFRLGIITNLLSETLVNGFTCASAFHVFFSQLKDLLGIPIRKRAGYFKLVKTLQDVVLALPEANRTVLLISFVFSIVMYLNNEYLKPWIAKRTRIPMPIELIAVIAGTLVSYCFNLSEDQGVNIINYIPTGLPAPTVPTLSLVKDIFLECFVVMIISYTVEISMAFLLAQKGRYEVDANQELLAMSLSNFTGSFFSCMPISASLSRSLIQYNVGGITQIASIISCFLLLFVLMWIGPIFEPLPKCVLASIIVVALKGMLMQFQDLRKYWKLSKWDAFVWIVTFFTTVLVDIDIGLLAGVIISLFSLLVRGNRPYTCLLGVLPSTDLYLDIKRYKGVQEIHGIKIFHYTGSLNFSSKTLFRTLLYKRVGFDPIKVLSKRARQGETHNYDESADMLIKCVIIDFSALSYIDPAGVDQLRQICNVYKQLNIEVYFTGCSGPVYEVLMKCNVHENRTNQFIIFPTVHDAVLFAQAMLFTVKKET
ncbi:prestin isoform X2 [Agrilus planipennis]|nr:prestin isoform X2 [Agrilus planipennis]XP_018323508.1 prestin isoform X2 [Agrilus planipennis]